jgi:hypothetical protein
MVTLLIYSLAFIGLVAVIIVVLDILAHDRETAQRARIQAETRRTQRQIQQIANDGLRAMLDEAQKHRSR